MPVTTRIITFLVGHPELNLHFPLLLGGGHGPQGMITKHVKLSSLNFENIWRAAYETLAGFFSPSRSEAGFWYLKIRMCPSVLHRGGSQEHPP